MKAVRVEMAVETQGELHLTDLPCRRGDKIEVIVLILEPSRPDPDAEEGAVLAARLTPTELRRMPREQRQAILAAAAMAEHDYLTDKELTGFEAFRICNFLTSLITWHDVFQRAFREDSATSNNHARKKGKLISYRS